jgi:hypothetical protein
MSFLLWALFAVSLLLLQEDLLVFEAQSSWAAEKRQEFEELYLDGPAQEAFRLWIEREREREIDEAVRRYWDYGLSNRSRRYSGYQMWFKLEQMQKWLKDPEHHRPPSPAPTPQTDLWMPYWYQPYSYSYPYWCPYSYYCPPSYPLPHFFGPFMDEPMPYYPYHMSPESYLK